MVVLRTKDMQSRLARAFTKAELLVVLGIVLVLFLVFSDAVSNAKYNARVASCKANFRVISLATQIYRSSHSGMMPPTLKALQPILKSQSPFMCPQSGIEDTPPYHAVAYEYRFLIKPNAKDIICWDSHPHLPQHMIFVWLNRPNRNVLLANGQVNNMPEGEFQQLHLLGQNWILP